MANLGLVVQNSRLLVLPGVRVPHLASHALALAARRLPDDWEELHGVRPAMACAFVGPEQDDTVHAAAGWQLAGRTSGHPPGRRGGGAPACGVWMLPLEPGWRERLRREPPLPRWLEPSLPALREDAGWAELEFGMSGHPDGRLRQRMASMARDWEKRTGEPVSVAFPAGNDQKAAYRLLRNRKVSMDDIMEGHRAATVQRCRDEPVVLAIQDTTMLDFSGLKGSTGGLAKPGAADRAVTASPRTHNPRGVGLRAGARGPRHRRGLPAGRHREGGPPPESRRDGTGAGGDGGAGDGDGGTACQREPALGGRLRPGSDGRPRQPRHPHGLRLRPRRRHMGHVRGPGGRSGGGRAAGALQRFHAALGDRRRKDRGSQESHAVPDAGRRQDRHRHRPGRARRRPGAQGEGPEGGADRGRRAARRPGAAESSRPKPPDPAGHRRPRQREKGARFQRQAAALAAALHRRPPRTSRAPRRPSPATRPDGASRNTTRSSSRAPGSRTAGSAGPTTCGAASPSTPSSRGAYSTSSAPRRPNPTGRRSTSSTRTSSPPSTSE